MQCCILAGGFATRLWPLTEHRAKPLLPLRGKPILTYVTDAVPRDIKITVSTNAVFADDMRAWAKSIADKHIDIMIEDSVKDTHKLGALGAISKWITDNTIDDDVLLLAGDNYCECNMRAFIDTFVGNPLLAAHDVRDREQAKQFGTVVLGPQEESSPLQQAMAFEEKPLEPRSTCVSTGWWILPKTSLRVLQEYAKEHPDNVGGIFEEFLRRKIRVDCFVFSQTWKDIGSFESYMAIHRQVVGKNQFIDPQANVDEHSTCTGSVVIGPKTVLRSSTIRDCIVFGTSTIDDCVLEECIIDEGCTLKGIDLRGKMLRAGTRLIA